MKKEISTDLKKLLEGNTKRFQVKKSLSSEIVTLQPEEASYILLNYNNKTLKNRKPSLQSIKNMHKT